MQRALFTTSSERDRRAPAAFHQKVRRLVTRPRFEHIERVARLAHAIAVGNRFDDGELEAVLVAATLHDAARDLPASELFRLAPPRDQLEREQPLAVHGRAGRRLAETWGVRDQRVLAAIEGHVFGVELDNRVGMAVYVADVCEPGRGVNDDIRAMAVCDLPAAYRRAVQSKVEYLQRNGKAVHPDTMKVYESISDGG